MRAVLQVVLVNVHLVRYTKPFSIKAACTTDAHTGPAAFESLISDVFLASTCRPNVIECSDLSAVPFFCGKLIGRCFTLHVCQVKSGGKLPFMHPFTYLFKQILKTFQQPSSSLL